MFDFRPISMSDRDRVRECLAVSDFRACEYCFANNLAWRRLADTVIDFKDDFYISCSFYGGDPVFTFPSGVRFDEQGQEKYRELFHELEKYTAAQGKLFKICSVGVAALPWFKDTYGERITVEENRDSFDYIYLTEDLITLRGKKYHGKRNHIKRFKERDWSFRLMDEQDFDACTAFAASFYNESEKSNFSAAVEQYAIHTYFENFAALGLVGGILYCGGEIAGFTIGEQLCSDTFVVHVEKARADIQGAYPTICQEFAKAAAFDYKYINREEDLGIEGLRRSKLSYHPAFLQEKYTVTFI